MIAYNSYRGDKMKEKLKQAQSSAINVTFAMAGIWVVILIVLSLYFKSLLIVVLGALGIGTVLVIVFKIIDVINEIIKSLKE